MKNGVCGIIASRVFDQLAAFAAYGFCKAHAASYAIIAYQALWLKCHYPAEFMAAILSNQPMGYYPPRVLVADAKRFGVIFLPPDINKSCGDYTLEGGAIRVSLRQLKGMSEEALESISSERERGWFTSIRDFMVRTDVSQSIAENLIRVGAFDAFGSRAGLLAELPKLVGLRHKVVKGIRPLFEDMKAEAHPVEETSNEDRKESILTERELLSLDLSAHPLDYYPLDDSFSRIEDLRLMKTGNMVKIIGSIIRYQTPPTRNGNRVVYIILEDGTGIADVTVFQDVQDKCGEVLFRKSWLIVEGKIQRRGAKSLSIIASNLSPVDWIIAG